MANVTMSSTAKVQQQNNKYSCDGVVSASDPH